MEEDARSLKIRRMQMVIQEALEFQRRELGQKLAIAQREFMIGLERARKCTAFLTLIQYFFDKRELQCKSI